MPLKFRTIIQYVKSVQIQSIFWSVFSRTEYRNLRSKSPHSVRIGKYRPEKTSHLDIFNAIHTIKDFFKSDFIARPQIPKPSPSITLLIPPAPSISESCIKIDSLWKVLSETVCFNRLYHSNLFKDSLPQILIPPIFNNLLRMMHIQWISWAKFANLFVVTE